MNHSDDVGFVDDGRVDREEENDLEEIGQSATEIINVDTSYQPKWGPGEGFRENYQNWKDGIMRSFNIEERDFKVGYVSSKNEKFYPVYHPTSKQLVGYIRFIYDSDNLGMLEMTNFKASLKRCHLGIGGTSKSADKKQIGQHGEGLKLAALVNRRHPHNYSFAILSSGYKWTFGWNIDKKLNCRIERIPKADIKRQKELVRQQEGKTATREATPRAWEDVSVIIGASVECRTIAGEKQSTNKIPLSEFEKWTKMTLDIQPPTDIVQTECGDLILLPDHKNKLYLHGLLLPSGSKSGKTFTYGYNLLDVSTGRDRDMVADANSESQQIAAIWENALIREGKSEKGVAERPLLSKYVRLLIKRIEKAADVYDIEDHMTMEIADMVWDRLRKAYPNAENLRPFYYCPQEDPQGGDVTRRCFKMSPCPLEERLWKMLRNFDLGRTTQEEREHRFLKAMEFSLKSDPFSDHILKALRALLASYDKSNNMKVLPVDGAGLGLVVLFRDNVFKLDKKWLTPEGAHEDAYCETFSNGSTEPDATFSCDHVVLWLWDNMLHELRSTMVTCHTLGSQTEAYLKSMARTKLQQMPRNITAYADATRSRLYVSWKSMEPHGNGKQLMRVTLHLETCKSLSEWQAALLYTPETCKCPSSTNTVKYGWDHSTMFDTTQGCTYVPVVSRDKEGAFYGVVSLAVSPSDPMVTIRRPANKKRDAPKPQDMERLFVKPIPED